MKNGDTIQLRQDLVINAVSTWDYYPEDADMSTTQALQALLDVCLIWRHRRTLSTFICLR